MQLAFAAREGYAPYVRALYEDDNCTLDDLRNVLTTLERMERIARRTLGGAHPHVVEIESGLKATRATLRARETLSRRREGK